MKDSALVEIRKAVPQDMEFVLNLIKELAVYENAAHEVSNNVEQLINDGFGQNPMFEVYVAEHQKVIIGFALTYIAYSTWKGKVLYLEDICVTESWRRKGVGKLLFDKIVQVAQQTNCKRLSWQVLEWNKPAIEFYKKYQSEFDAEWLNCKIRF